MEIIILCALFGVFILLSFTIGLSFGCKLRNNENIEVPDLNPVKRISKSREEKQIKKERDLQEEILKVSLENIENYDGTEYGQKDIPE